MTSATPAERRSPPPGRAFTLMEMVLVLVIVALVAALAAPAMSRAAARLTADAAGFELVGLLRQARHVGAVTGRPCTVWLRPDGRGYSVSVTAGGREGGPEAVLAQEWARPMVIPFTPVLSSAAAGQRPTTQRELGVRFGPRGVDRDYFIDLPSQRGQPSRIEIRRPSGLVRMAAPGGEADRDQVQRLVQNYWEASCAHASP